MIPVRNILSICYIEGKLHPLKMHLYKNTMRETNVSLHEEEKHPWFYFVP